MALLATAIRMTFAAVWNQYSINFQLLPSGNLTVCDGKCPVTVDLPLKSGDFH
jgi:hypothetical protein